MKRSTFTLGSVATVLLLSAGPALAQRPEPGAGSAERGGGGGAVSSGGGGGGGNIASSGGSSSGSTSSSVGSMSPSVSTVTSPSIGMGDRGFRSSAPEHRVSFSDDGRAATRGSSGGGQQAAPRSSGGGQQAAPRSGGGASSSGSPARTAPSSGGGERATPRGVAGSNNTAAGRRAGESTAGSNNASGAQEVPNWARSRGARPATGNAVQREGPMPPRSASDRLRYGGYYDPYYYGGFGYGFGFYTGVCSPAYYSCDQGFYGYPFYSPFGFGYGIPAGYFDPYYSDPYDYGAGYGAYSSQVYGGHDQGNLKLKVKPHNAKVYVDGFYAGLVDEFDGAFQKLTLNGGRHKVELRADGYESTEFDVLITPGQTVTFAGEMRKSQ